MDLEPPCSLLSTTALSEPWDKYELYSIGGPSFLEEAESKDSVAIYLMIYLITLISFFSHDAILKPQSLLEMSTPAVPSFHSILKCRLSAEYIFPKCNAYKLEISNTWLKGARGPSPSRAVFCCWNGIGP